MKSLPYSIYVDKRPIKIAFFIGKDITQEKIGQIFEYNHDKWGGRFNPIIVTDGNTISDSQWNFLRDYDPDVISSMVDLDDNLLKLIDRFLSPYRVIIKNPEDHPAIDDDPASILPTSDNISKLSYHSDNSKVVIFKFSDDCDILIKKFITWNFGFLDDSFYHTRKILELLDNGRKEVIEISNIDSLNNALLSLGDFHKPPFVYPIQLCALSSHVSDIKYEHRQEEFTVIVGDSNSDLVYFWNKSLLYPHWMRNGITHLWLPEQLATNQQLQSGLSKWLKKYSSLSGNQGQQGLTLTTSSVSTKDMDQLLSDLEKDIYLPKKIDPLSEFPAVHFSDPIISPSYLRKLPYMDYYNGYSDHERIVLKEPDLQEGGMRGEYWMSDIYIQFRPERFSYILNSQFWWQLPQKNVFAQRFFKRPARINRDGFFSVLVRRKGDPEFGQIDICSTELDIKLPDDLDIFWELICEKNLPCYTNDQRSRILSREFSNIKRSDKGRYLSGVLDLFLNLHEVDYFLSKNYWRRIFDLMSNRTQGSLTTVQRRLENKLSKIADLNKIGVDRLAKIVLREANSFSVSSKELSLSDFNYEAQKENNQYQLRELRKTIQSHSLQEMRTNLISLFRAILNSPLKKDFSKDQSLYFEAVTRGLRNLLEKNIIFMGVRPRCPSCGYRSWRSLKEMDQTLSCVGCGKGFYIKPEEKYFYKLNTLVSNAFSQHGLIPVILVLAQLLSRARCSFIFAPCLDLFRNGSKQSIGDLDIACIRDGQFIIGEIKNSSSGFNFEKLEEIARLLIPDRLILSVLKKPSKEILGKIEELKVALSDLEIDVEWYDIYSYKLEPGLIC